MKYRIEPCNSEEAEYIDDKLVEYNLYNVPVECDPKNLFDWFGRKITDNEGRIIAGCLAGVSVWRTAEISILWVDESYRKQGLGSHLLKAVEQEIKEKGCTIIQLDTFDWQAREFYEKNGYSVFGKLADCPQGHCRFYMKKNI